MRSAGSWEFIFLPMNNDGVTYKELSPHPLLQEYVKTYWFFSYKIDTPESFEILPDGYFDMIFSFENKSIRRTHLVGIWTRKETMNYADDTQIIGIRFKPQALIALLDLQLKELLDKSVFIDLGQWGFNRDLLDSNIDNPYVVKKYFDNHLLSILNINKIDKRINGLFGLIEKSGGCMTIESISHNIGLSTRQIHRKTNELIGIGAKDYAKIIRFKKALSLIKEDRSNYEGYFDQSHFIKNFRLYTGLKPSEVELGKDVRFLQYYDFDSD